ncbi:hypothetical protein DL765_002790 [Monosporascus sp. GIB2]|nr:hypothetical protein DL765_002790 [Monosporascus sp. GIB2]
MAPGWNIFRISGDISHIVSKCILIFAIHRNRSAEGVSMITQILYAVVFCSRYTDLFSETYAWNVFFKVFYILSSIYIIVIMRWMFPRTREREIAWKLGAATFGGSLLIAPFVMIIFEDLWNLFTWAWDFSVILESVCVLLQLLLLRQTTVPTVIDSFYLLTLGAYRALYILNWIWRAADANDRPPNAVLRVKLRNGGIVDADDIRRGWLLRRIFGHRRFAAEVDGADDEESAPALGGGGGAVGGARNAGRPSNRWGARGISVSADDGVYEQDRDRDRDQAQAQADRSRDEFSDTVDPDTRMKDPDELARALDDDDDDDDDDDAEDAALRTARSGGGNNGAASSGVNNESEWRD